MMFNDKVEQVFDDRAVSPVVGVILMVAITVILAAVIGTAVLDIGGNVNENANAGVSVEQTSDGVVVTWLNNQNTETLEVLVNGEDPSPSSDNNTLTGVGDSLTVQTNAGDTVTVVGTTSSGSTTTIQSETASQKTLPSGETEPKVTESSTDTTTATPTTSTLLQYDTTTEWEQGVIGDSSNTSIQNSNLTLQLEGNYYTSSSTHIDVTNVNTINVTLTATSASESRSITVEALNSSGGAEDRKAVSFNGSETKTVQLDVSGTDSVRLWLNRPNVMGSGVSGDVNVDEIIVKEA